MITMATVLLGTDAHKDRPGPRIWRVLGRWFFTGLIGLGSAMGGAWIGDPFGYTAKYCDPWATRPTDHADHGRP